MPEKIQSEPEINIALNEIKKEVTEARNLTIKTDNLIQNLSAQLKEMEKKQRKYERKYIVSSAVSYLIFIGLIGAGAYFIAESRMESVRAELQAAIDEIKRLEEVLAKKEKAETAAQLNDRIAEEMLELFNKERFEEGIAKWEKVNENLLNRLVRKMLKGKVGMIRAQVAEELFNRGKQQFTGRNYKMAIATLQKAASIDPKGDVAPKAMMKWGEALEAEKLFQEAIEIYKRIALEHSKHDLADDALWQLGQRHDAMGNVSEAVEAFETLVEKYPESGFSRMAKARAQTLRKRLETGGQASPAPAVRSVSPPPPKPAAAPQQPAPRPPSPTPEPEEPPRPAEP